MIDLPLQHPFRLLANPAPAAADAPYGAHLQAVLSHAASRTVQAEVSTWPGYAPTPLRDLGGLARRCGLGAVWYKDEASRFGLGSFKSLGGAYAVLSLLQRELRHSAGREVSSQQLAAGELSHLTANVTVTCATDGNHGRAVAWGARTFGCNCVVFVHEHVSAARADAIAAYGAEVLRVPGTYDEAVRRAAREAELNGWHVISDTSYEGYQEVPREIMQGYTVLVNEALQQLPSAQLPTHVFVQGGVGGLAAAVCGHLWEALGPRRPTLCVVEPERADCLYRSAEAGQPTVVGGGLETIMAGLSCGEVSLLAFEVLKPGTDFFLSIPDDAAADAMRLLAEGSAGDTPFAAGESGVAGLAGLLCVLGDDSARAQIGLSASSRVLLIGSEGPTDPEGYARIVGRSAEEVNPS